MAAKLRRLDRRSFRLPCRFSTARRHKDANTESKFRKPGKRVQDFEQHGPQRRIQFVLQGFDAEITHDRTEVSLQLLVGTDSNTGLQQNHIKRK